MSFDTALSGIRAASSDLSVVGNNISNSATTGFKSSRAEFADVYYASSIGGMGANTVGQGVNLQAVTQQFSQGNISFTDNALDLAINGSGFFQLNADGSRIYTRAGNFHVNSDGIVVNNQGYELMALGADNNGQITGTVGNIDLNTSYIDPQATTAVEGIFNLDSREVEPLMAWGGPFDAFATPPTAPDPQMYTSATSNTIYDSLGNAHTMSTYFRKTANANEWEAYTLIDGVSATGPDTFAFDTNGRFDSASLPVEISVAGWQPLDANGAANGAAAQSFTIDLSESTQFGTDFAVNALSQDGYTSGQLASVDIDETGVIFARYTNGQSQVLGQVVLANFPNIQGLQPLGNTSWAETYTSGAPVVSTPATAGMGVIQAGALEESNVDLTSELVSLITAQRNFQANAQTIRTEDAVTQTIINLR